jgi:copper chaperone CopZ
MTNRQFKTNISCGGCVATVTPFLNEVAGAGGWQVDTTKPEKTLTISNESISDDAVAEAVKKAGFRLEALVA